MVSDQNYVSVSSAWPHPHSTDAVPLTLCVFSYPLKSLAISISRSPAAGGPADAAAGTQEVRYTVTTSACIHQYIGVQKRECTLTGALGPTK